MHKHKEFPHMLFKDGKVSDDYRIVADGDEEAAAAKLGYLRYHGNAVISDAEEDGENDGGGDVAGDTGSEAGELKETPAKPVHGNRGKKRGPKPKTA